MLLKFSSLFVLVAAFLTSAANAGEVRVQILAQDDSAFVDGRIGIPPLTPGMQISVLDVVQGFLDSYDSQSTLNDAQKVRMKLTSDGKFVTSVQGLEAHTETASNGDTLSYGWCFKVNANAIDQSPSETNIDVNTTDVSLYYGYVVKSAKTGQWVPGCFTDRERKEALWRKAISNPSGVNVPTPRN